MNCKILKIILISFLLIILLPLISFGEVTYPEPSDKFYINDFADVIDDEVENLIAENGNALEEKTEAQIVLVTVNFTDGISIDEYAAELFNKWKLGSAEKNNGLLILLSIGDEDYWAVQGKGLEVSLTSGEISQILFDYLEDDFAAENYSEGAAKVYEAFTKRLGGNWIGEKDFEVEDSKNIENNKNVEDYKRNENNQYSGSSDTRNMPNPDYSNPSKSPDLPGFFNLPVYILRRTFNMIGKFFKYFFILIIFIAISSKRRKYYRRRFGIPFNPFSWIRKKRYGPGGYWGHYGPPPPGGGVWYNGRWNSNPRPKSGHERNTPPGSAGSGSGSSSGTGPFSSGNNSWGPKSGGGGSTRGGGAGRSSFGGSPFSRGSSFGSSSSRRSSFGGSKPFSGGKSFGGRSGGGGFTRGGGAGRRK